MSSAASSICILNREMRFNMGMGSDLISMCCKNRAVISYGEAAADRLSAMKDAIAGMMTAKEIGQIMERISCSRLKLWCLHGILSK